MTKIFPLIPISTITFVIAFVIAISKIFMTIKIGRNYFITATISVFNILFIIFYESYLSPLFNFFSNSILLLGNYISHLSQSRYHEQTAFIVSYTFAALIEWLLLFGIIIFFERSIYYYFSNFKPTKIITYFNLFFFIVIMSFILLSYIQECYR